MDLLVFAAHPDDAELQVGGIIRKMVLQGHSVGIVDLSRGERATRGTPEERLQEAEAAAEILGVAVRENLGLPDGNIQSTPEQRERVVQVLRKHRPGVVLAPYWKERHPDHCRAGTLVWESSMLAGLGKAESPAGRYLPSRILYYPGWGLKVVPTLVVDITSVFEDKMRAIRAFKSQFYNPDYEGEPTYLTRPEFFEEVEARARFYGTLIGVKYGEALYSAEILPVEDPVSLWG